MSVVGPQGNGQNAMVDLRNGLEFTDLMLRFEPQKEIRSIIKKTGRRKKLRPVLGLFFSNLKSSISNLKFRI